VGWDVGVGRVAFDLQNDVRSEVRTPFDAERREPGRWLVDMGYLLCVTCGTI